MLETRAGRSPAKFALDETIIAVDDDRFWFVFTVVPETNNFPRAGLYFHRMSVPTEMLLREMEERHDIETTEFPVDGTPWHQTGGPRTGYALLPRNPR